MTKTLERGCLLCEREDVKPLLTQKGNSFVRCRHCGLIYQNPPPPADESRKYYEKGYYEKLGDRNVSIHKARLSVYRNFLSQCAVYRRTGRILDIGCGYGDFLRMAQEQGWEVWGIEPSREAGESAQKVLGSRVLNGTVESVDFPPNHFDVITLWNVIDCLPDPLAALAKIQAWLSPGGVLLIRTPNSFFHWAIYRLYSSFGSLFKKIGWDKEASVFLRANFDVKTLRKLLELAGFSTLEIRNGEPTEGDAYQVSSRSSLTALAKSWIYGISRFVSFFSGNRLLIGSTLIARASPATSPPKFEREAMRRRIILKSVILHLLALAGYLLGLPLWFKIFGKDREIRILLYHSINELRQNDVNVRESQFRKQLDFLRTRYSVIALEEAVATLKKGVRPLKRCVALTFDDGYKDNYQVAFPLLKEKGFHATIFLLTGGGPNRELTHLIDDQPQYNRLLSWEEVREMASAGISFGSHGETHVRLTDLPTDPLTRETLSSKEKIETEIRGPVYFFSYPYGVDGDFDRRAEFFVRETGYEAAFSAIFGTNGEQGNPYALKRIGIEASDTLFTFRAKLNGALSLLSLLDFPPIRWVIRWFDSFLLGRAPTSLRKEPPLLLVSVDFPPHSNGVSTIARELSVRIAKRGSALSVIGPRDRGDQEFDRLQPYRIFRFSGYSWGHFRLIPILFWMPWVVWRFGIRKVFAMNIAYGGILAWALSYLFPLEYLIFAYGYEFEKVRDLPFLCWLYRKIYNRAKGIVACSELVRERLNRFGGPPEKIQVLYPAVDLNRYRPSAVPREYLEKNQFTGRRILLTVGRLIERKGHDQVLRALPKIIETFPDALYCIVGIGPHEEELRKEVGRLNLEKHVRFMGKVSEEELVWLYNVCEVFVMPSREISEGGHLEGFGIVYLEANACAKPVIGGRSGGVGEAIVDGQTGFLVNPHSESEIADKIIDLFSHPRKAQDLGAVGLERVQRTFDWEHYVERVCQLVYDEIRQN